ncbi:hypothetical protein WA026_015841 [Henosepilachna vigintioctopunctata]|uniref:Uncharacterized protein n=1 Tax=Henosepilachna vigintioctopunctata TaxID=420089 RepID=A0AAW1UZJ9_9CUCU
MEDIINLDKLNSEPIFSTSKQTYAQIIQSNTLAMDHNTKLNHGKKNNDRRAQDHEKKIDVIFTTVNYKKRRNPEIVGNKNTNLKGVLKMVSIYISRIDADSTEESIKNHLIENGIKQFEMKMGYSTYPNIYKSYIITVPSNILEKIKEPQLWPEGTSISNFLYQLAKPKEQQK